MAWVTLSLRKQSLQRDISDTTSRILQLSRSIRSIHRNLSYEQTIFNNLKSSELRESKLHYQDRQGTRPTRSEWENDDAGYNEAYTEWQTNYQRAQEDYQEDKLGIQEYYDQKLQDLEEEAQDQEDFINDQKTKEETELQALQAELSAINDQIKTDIQSEAISF